MCWKCPAVKNEDGLCCLNPNNLLSICINCDLCYKKTRKRFRRLLKLNPEPPQPMRYLPEYGELTAWDEPPKEDIPQCPYYGGDCMVFSGTGAIGEWCVDCANHTPGNLFQKIKRKRPGRKRKPKPIKEFEHERYCPSCGNFFYAIQDHQKYCSVKCRKREKFRRYFKRKREQKAELATRRATGKG